MRRPSRGVSLVAGTVVLLVSLLVWSSFDPDGLLDLVQAVDFLLL